MKNRPIKRKIIQDRTIPGSNQINKHQNFDRLLNDHALIKKLFFKKLLIWSTAVIGTAVVAGIILTTKSTPVQPVPTKVPVVAQEADAPFIQPPFPGLETPFSTYHISAGKGATLTHENGSVLIIPPLAFTNKEGKIITDSIELKYREYHDPCSIFLSGIPMHYDSAGTKYTFESAGMVEIRAFDKQQELEIAANKKINICMISSSDESRFNLYKLDESVKNWIYKGKDRIESLSKSSTSKKTTTNAQPEIAAINSIQPALSDPQKYSFKIDYEEKNFPELAAYKDVLFEVTDKTFKPAYFKINWDHISLYNAEEKGTYLVKLHKKDTTISVTAVPVFDKAHYEEALSTFNKKHNQSTTYRDQQELEKTKKLNAVNTELNELYSKSVNTPGRLRNTIARTFSIASMGTYNCDYPLQPYPIVFNPVKTKISDDNKQLAYSTIFLIEKGKNAIFRFSKTEAVRCKADAENLIWTITDKNNIAFFDSKNFINASTGNERILPPVVAVDQKSAIAVIRNFSQ
ncbi:MAG TPA: hypothetical protein PLL00_04490 [Bacteroidia bacterium]|nr:hypothetical protein [Bacteroidia bacterium]